MSGRKVLIFEFDQPFAAALGSAFERRGAEVTVVEDGQAGLEVLNTARPDLIVLAIELPRMNGFAVCNRIKKNPDTKDIPLVIVSSDSPQETFEQHSKLRTRAEHYEHKPIDAESLAAQAWALLGEGAAGDGVDDIVVDDVALEIEGEVDSEVSGLTDNAFDRIMAPAFDPAPEAPASAAAGLPPVPDDFEDLTLVSSSSTLNPALYAAVKSAQARVGASQPPPASATAPSTPSLRAPPVLTPLRAPTPAPVHRASMAPAPVSPEAESLRRRVEELERELAVGQAARQRVVELTEENQRLRAQGDELARVTRELEEARARAASASTVTPAVGAPGRGVSTREFLELREALNRKDKDILARDRELVELRDRMLQSDLARADIDDRLYAREQELEALKAELSAAQAQGSAGAEQAASLQRAAAEAQEREAAARAEGESLRARLGELEEALASSRSRLGELESRLAETERGSMEVVGARDAALAAAAAAQAAHAAEIESLRAQHASALDEARSSHASELESLRAQHASEVESTRASLVGELESARTSLVAEAESARAAHAAEVEAARAAGEARAQELSSALESLRAEHREALSTAEAARADVERLANERGEALLALRGELDALRESGGERAAALQTELDDLRRELSEARAAVQSLQRQADHGHAMLDRARRALEIAAALVDEATSPVGADTGEHASLDAGAEALGS
ncbi:MAG: response regulator [Polyangiales bacterium]